jgi:competence protein ComEC
VILSHADADHYNLLPTLLERFSVGVVYVSPVMFDEPSRALTALEEAIDEAGGPIREVFANDRLRGGEGCVIEVLHPPRRGVLGSDNANSLVLAIEYHGRRILLPGDLEPPGLDDVLAEKPWDCDVLLAPHHGSRRSNPPGLAAWSTPEWVIISGGLADYQAETEATYRAAGGQVLLTGRIGAVQVLVEDGGMEVAGFLGLR